MTVYLSIATGFLDSPVNTLKQGMLHFDFTATDAANNMMVIIPRDLISEVSIARMG